MENGKWVKVKGKRVKTFALKQVLIKVYKWFCGDSKGWCFDSL
jgi:hypothetical protein